MLNQAWYVIAKVGSRFSRPPKASIPADPSAIQIKSATSFDMLSRSSPLGACCFHCVWPCNLLIFAEIRPEVPQIHEIESSLSRSLSAITILRSALNCSLGESFWQRRCRLHYQYCSVQWSTDQLVDCRWMSSFHIWYML